MRYDVNQMQLVQVLHYDADGTGSMLRGLRKIFFNMLTWPLQPHHTYFSVTYMVVTDNDFGKIGYIIAYPSASVHKY